MAFKSVGNPAVYQLSECTITTSASVTTSSVLLVPQNSRRVAFYLWNNSANSVYISFAPTSSAATPTKILATFTTWEKDGTVCWTGPISAIRNSGSGTLTIYELLL